MSAPLSEMGRAALRWARLGVPVFPCDPRTKRPLTETGVLMASTRPVYVKFFWTLDPHAMIGAAMGERSGLWALDLDVKPGEGVDAVRGLAQLCREIGAQPIRTVAQTTPSGGVHLLFRFERSLSGVVKNRAMGLPLGAHKSNGVLAGVDTRGTGGYVVLSPSRRQDGRAYSLRGGVDLEDLERRAAGAPLSDVVAPAPDWLIERLRRLSDPAWKSSDPPPPLALSKRAAPAPRSGGPPAHRPRYAQTALDNERSAVAVAAPGRRNRALNDAAFNLGQLVGARALRRPEVEHALFEAACLNGQVAEDGEKSIRAVIASGLAAGEQRPRDLSGVRR